MGGIHPRFKREVGRRLALAYDGKFNSPTLAGCNVDSTDPKAVRIDLRFDAALLGGDTLKLQWNREDYNMSGSVQRRWCCCGVAWQGVR